MTIALIDPDSADRERIRQLVAGEASEPLVESDGMDDLEYLLRRADLRLVLLEYRLPGGDGLQLLQRLREKRPDVAAIMVTAHGDEDVAVAGMKAGLFDYIPKGRLEQRLAPAVREALSGFAPRMSEERPALGKLLETRFLRAQRLESIGALAGEIVHDLNNILTPIRLGANLLRRINDESKRLALLDIIVRNVNRGAELLRQVLDFAGGQSGEFVPLALPPILEATGRFLEHGLPSSIQMEIDVEPELWPVLGDATQIKQVLLNLAVNARDAMSDGGKLAIHARNITLDASAASAHPEARSGRYVAIRVADTGTGIAPENLERIFDPFFTTKDPSKGSGLGLSTVSDIIRRHDGFLDVETQLVRGTTFHLWLPATDRT